MSVVLDYTARIAPAALKAADVVGVCRYIAPQTWKTIKLPEYRELLAAGIAVYLNWESSARDWSDGTAGAKADATSAVAMARDLGYPTGSVLIGSCDYDLTWSGWTDAGRAYGREFARVIRGGGYRPGVYGPYDVLKWVRDEGLMDAFWQAGMSWSWSQGRNDARPPKKQPFPGAHLIQRAHRTVGGQDTDWSEILIPDWGRTGTMTTPLSADNRDFVALWSAMSALRDGASKIGVGPVAGADMWTVQTLKRVEALLLSIAAKVDIDASELAAIEAAAQAGAEAGVLAGADDIVAQILAGIQQGADLTPAQLDQVEQAVRDAFAGGLAPDVEVAPQA
jgi:hypothetical protein